MSDVACPHGAGPGPCYYCARAAYGDGYGREQLAIEERDSAKSALAAAQAENERLAAQVASLRVALEDLLPLVEEIYEAKKVGDAHAIAERLHARIVASLTPAALGEPLVSEPGKPAKERCLSWLDATGRCQRGLGHDGGHCLYDIDDEPGMGGSLPKGPR